MRIEDNYPQDLNKLSELFGQGEINAKLHILNEIHAVVEEAWNSNVERLFSRNISIKYLFIGEAAPPIKENYFYHDCSGKWCQPIVDAMFVWSERSYDLQVMYDKLADKRFLLVDTLPFAMDYSIRKQRGKPAYGQLVKMCAYSYLHDKLFDKRLKWDIDVSVAFGLRKNAEAMIQAFPKGFKLPNGQVILFKAEQIAVTAANYPSRDRIKEVFDLS